jgi:gluconate 2-dehydrogenase gamma chain
MTKNKDNNPINHDRREALKVISMLTGYAITAGAASAFLAGCKADPKAVQGTSSVDNATGSIDTPYKTVFSNDQLALLTEISERIIPKTDTPGAKDAGVSSYIDQTVSLFYKEEDKKRFLEKLTSFDKIANDKYKKNFVQLSDENKDDVLKIMASEWKKNDKENHIFKEMRDLTVTGYCTSEVGAKKLLVYDAVPGPYQGCIDRSTVKGVYAL